MNGDIFMKKDKIVKQYIKEIKRLDRLENKILKKKSKGKLLMLSANILMDTILNLKEHFNRRLEERTRELIS